MAQNDMAVTDTAQSRMVDVVVIGAGMLGVSAAKHLVSMGADVILVGQPEPKNKAIHDGVFASHYDSARIVRITDRDPFYARIAAASIARFVDLENKTGVRFFYPVGHVTVSQIDGYLVDLKRQATANELVTDELDVKQMSVRFPDLEFASDTRAIVEHRTGGYIDPRAFIRSQRAAVELGRGITVDSLVSRLDIGRSSVAVQLEDGSQLRGRAALLATGAFANQPRLLKRQIDLTVTEHTVVFGQLRNEDADRLQAMPTIIYKRGDSVGESVYVTPPIRDSQGRAWIKIGQSTGHIMRNPDSELTPWFRSSGDVDAATWLRRDLQKLLPEVSFVQTETEPCVVSQSPSGRPYIDLVSSEAGPEVLTLLAGNGQVAKSADELGRIAAVRLSDGVFPPEYRGENFQLRYLDD